MRSCHALGRCTPCDNSKRSRSPQEVLTTWRALDGASSCCWCCTLSPRYHGFNSLGTTPLANLASIRSGLSFVQKLAARKPPGRSRPSCAFAHACAVAVDIRLWDSVRQAPHSQAVAHVLHRLCINAIFVKPEASSGQLQGIIISAQTLTCSEVSWAPSGSGICTYFSSMKEQPVYLQCCPKNGASLSVASSFRSQTQINGSARSYLCVAMAALQSAACGDAMCCITVSWRRVGAHQARLCSACEPGTVAAELS